MTIGLWIDFPASPRKPEPTMPLTSGSPCLGKQNFFTRQIKSTRKSFLLYLQRFSRFLHCHHHLRLPVYPELLVDVPAFTPLLTYSPQSNLLKIVHQGKKIAHQKVSLPCLEPSALAFKSKLLPEAGKILHNLSSAYVSLSCDGSHTIFLLFWPQGLCTCCSFCQNALTSAFSWLVALQHPDLS